MKGEDERRRTGSYSYKVEVSNVPRSSLFPPSRQRTSCDSCSFDTSSGLESFYKTSSKPATVMFPLLLTLTAIPIVFSFPFLLNTPSIHTHLLPKEYHEKHKRDDPTCPFNPVHSGAAPFNPKFPYTGAKNGKPGTQSGGIEVPNDFDTAHFFKAPGPLDIRGPCPGLNTAANHNVGLQVSLFSVQTVTQSSSSVTMVSRPTRNCLMHSKISTTSAMILRSRWPSLASA